MERNKVFVVSIIICLLMLILPTGISESVDEIENIEKLSDTYGRCKFQVNGRITYASGQRYFGLASNLYFWCADLHLKIEQKEGWRTLVIRTLPDNTPHFYEGDVTVTITDDDTSREFLGFIYTGEYIQFCRGRASNLKVEEI